MSDPGSHPIVLNPFLSVCLANSLIHPHGESDSLGVKILGTEMFLASLRVLRGIIDLEAGPAAWSKIATQGVRAGSFW